MAPLKIALVGVLGIGVAASLAFADHKPNHPGGSGTASGTWVFAGYSTTTVLGNATLPGMYAACQFDFGDNARMAIMEEWVKSPNITLPPTDAWIQASDGRPSNQINCEGWTVTTGAGRVLQTNGKFETSSCATPPLAVACVVTQ